MKNLIISTTMAVLPLCLQAMEIPQDPTPEQTMARFFQMTIHDLDELAKNTQETFKALKDKRIVSFPFDPEQATILTYSYQESPPEIEGVSWKLLHKGEERPISMDFFSLIHLANHLQKESFYEPSSRFNFGSSINKFSPFLKHARKFAIVGIDERSYTRHDNDTSGLKLTIESVYKIAKHFRCLQTTFSDLPNATTWGWVTMRYHLEKTTHYFGAIPPIKEKLFYKPLSSVDLVNPKYEKNIHLINQIESISSLLAKTLGLTILDKGENKSYTPTPKEYRQILKVLFSEMPHLGLVNSFKECDGYNEFFTFAQLYLDLTKNYKKNPTTGNSISCPYNIKKLVPLLSNINGSPLTEKDALIVLNNEKGRKTLAKILKVFANPFSPTIQELNTFSYYADEIIEILVEKREALKKSKEIQSSDSDKDEAPSREENSFLSSIRCDLYEFWDTITGKKTKDN